MEAAECSRLFNVLWVLISPSWVRPFGRDRVVSQRHPKTTSPQSNEAPFLFNELKSIFHTIEDSILDIFCLDVWCLRAHEIVQG